MRGHDEQTPHVQLSPEQRVPADHPLRAVRALTERAETMSRRFAGLYAKTGRPSILSNYCCCRCCTRSGANGC